MSDDPEFAPLEQHYMDGRRAAYLHLLGECLRQLGHEAPDAARLVKEREEAVAQLRRLCAEHGDSDWTDDLHLADIIDKHLGRYLIIGEAAPDAPLKP